MSQDPETVGILLVAITKIDVSCCLSPETVDDVYMWENKSGRSALFQIGEYPKVYTSKVNSVTAVMIRY